MMANRDKIGRGLGSLGKRIGDFRQKTTGYRTQAEYDQAREDRRAQARTDRMIDRITSGKRTRSNPRDAGTTKAQKDAISAAMRESRRGGQYDSGGGSGGGGGKVVCTMMNERYGFGSFRNKIWMKFHESYGPEYQKGYHAIFLPLVKIAKGEGKINTAVRKVLEHMGRHVTADMFKIMKGKKRDTLGRIYRAIFEPTCRIIGKIKSALGRG
jgi:Sec-independent protein translocase protein TatA